MRILTEEDEKDTDTAVMTGADQNPGDEETGCNCTLKSIEDLQPGDHLCYIYDTEEEHRELMTPYLKTGLEKGEKVFYIVDARTAETVLGYLRDSGVEVEPYLASGQLSILSVGESYMASGEFDPDGMIGMLTDETDKALAEGYGALRVTGEMSWALRGLPGSERLMEYEAKLNRFFPQNKCLAICQYDRRMFEPSVLLNVLLTHPFAVLGTELFDNFYYVPTDEFLAGEPQRATLKRWVSSLRERKATEETLRQSEEKYRTLFENMLEGFMLCRMIYDDDGNPVDWIFLETNKAFEELNGLRNVDGKNVTEVIPGIKETNPELLETYGRVALTGKPEQIEVRVESLSIDLSIKAFSPMQDCFVAVFENISERKTADEALRRSESYHHALVEQAMDCITVLDEFGIITYESPSITPLLGYAQEELVGKSVFDYIHPEDIPTAVEAFVEGMQTSEKHGSQMEVRFKHRDGSWRNFWGVGRNLLDEPSIHGVILNSRDITERKQAAEALRVSEEHYRLLVENASEVILTTDLELIVTYASPSVERQTGFTSEEVTGHDSREFITSESFDAIAGVLADQLAMQGETDVTPPVPVMIEVEQYRKDGSTYPAEVSAGFLRDSDGTPYGVIVVSRNITDKHEAEEALRRSEEGFRQFADNLPEVVFEADSLGRFVYVNSNALEAFGYTEEELYSSSVSILEMLSEEYRELAAEKMARILSGGTAGSNEYMARRKEGSSFPVIISTLPVIKGEMIVGLRGVLTDITAQKETEEALRRVNAELDGYAHIVSHDLKGPLSAVALAAEALQGILEGEGGEGAGGFTGEAVRIIRENTTRAVKLTRDLLVLAEAGQAPVIQQPVDISEVAGSVLKEKEALLKDHGVRVSPNGDLGVAAMDPTHAYQLFANLVGNAIKYNDSKNPEIHICHLGETEPGRLRYLVRDNGQGIPEQLLETLFTPFVKGERGGTGIGLSIVDKVVRLYGGEIRAYNDDGACFEFTLPPYSQ